MNIENNKTTAITPIMPMDVIPLFQMADEEFAGTDYYLGTPIEVYGFLMYVAGVKFAESDNGSYTAKNFVESLITCLPAFDSHETKVPEDYLKQAAMYAKRFHMPDTTKAEEYAKWLWWEWIQGKI